MKFEILSRKTVKPSTPTPHHLQKCKLSFFDQVGRPVHVPMLLFYSSSSAAAAVADDDIEYQENDNSNKNVSKLEKSLSETLSRFYPMAGRLGADGESIDCHDQGVEFVEAQMMDVKISDLIHEGTKNNILLEILVPTDIGDSSLPATPLLATQATQFSCGGLALCIYASHVIVDANTAVIFSNAWAESCRRLQGKGIDEGGAAAIICPSFDMGSMFPPRDLPKSLRNYLPVKTQEKLVTRIFQFDAEAISDLKEKVIVMSSSKRIPSRSLVVTAALWKALIRVIKAKHGQSVKTSLLCSNINLRGRISMTVPENSCGNLFIKLNHKYMLQHNGKAEPELHGLVEITRNNITDTIAACAKASTSDEIFSLALKHINETRQDLSNSEVYVCSSSSLCRFPFYENDFGRGKPCWVGLIGRKYEIISLMDTKCGTGVEAFVTLKEENMNELERDPDIIELATSKSNNSIS